MFLTRNLHYQRLNPITVKKTWIKNIAKSGGTLTWDNRMYQLMIEMLSHRTAPSCIPQNILSVCEILLPQCQIIQALPAVNVVREARSVLSFTTKALAAYQLGRVPTFKQLFANGTSRRQTSIQNCIIGFLGDGGFKTVTLSNSILGVDDTATCITNSIVHLFKECGEMLDSWREVTKRMYPGRQDLIDQIPSSKDLSLGKMASGGIIMKDGCATASKVGRQICEVIKKVAEDMGSSPEDVSVFEGDCWQHMQNVWFGAITSHLSQVLKEVLEEDIEEIPNVLRITTDIVMMLRAAEKEFGETANYHKGHGSMFTHRMRTYHTGAFLYSLERALGGNIQDVGIEGSPALLMNIPFYLDFLNWRGGMVDNILQKNLYIELQSVEVVALVRCLSILHISICLPTRWLAGNTEDLGDYNFGLFDMGVVVDTIEDKMMMVVNDGSLFLDESFMMIIFSDLSEQIEPFQQYLQYIFEEKQSNPVGSRSDENKFLPFDELRAELFYPTRKDIRQSTSFCLRLAGEIACVFLRELRDKSKVTHEYLSSMMGTKSVAVVSESMREAGRYKSASNSISESGHASATQSLKLYGTIRLDHAAAEGQTRVNDDYGRGYKSFITRSAKSVDVTDREMGAFHKIVLELQHTLIQTGREQAVATREAFNEALKLQRESRQEKEEVARRKKIDAARENFIDAMYLWEQYHSPRCWKTAKQAREEFKKLKSAAQKMKAVLRE